MINWYNRGWNAMIHYRMDTIDEMLARYPEQPDDAQRNSFLAGARMCYELIKQNITPEQRDETAVEEHRRMNG